MEKFIIPVQVRWADLDPNFHLRHSIYYDWAAMCRIDFLNRHGLTTETMMKLQFGPIIFREEAVFKKEIKLGDDVTIDLELMKSRKDYSRWSFQHTIRKNNETATIVVVDGAWLDTVKRKLTVPPMAAVNLFNQMPRGSNFQLLD